MKTQVEMRYPLAGFVYVGETRMVFGPDDDHNDENTLLLHETAWGRPSSAEREACQKALRERFPDRTVKLGR